MPHPGVGARVCAAMAAFLLPQAGAQEPDRIGAPDLALVRELFHLTDTVGGRLWPGFDTRQIPIAVNHRDQQELLVGHPQPPKEFAPFGDIDGVPALLREGSTRYGPRGGGWAVELAGSHTAYVGTRRGTQPTEDWLLLLLHECFHVYQNRYRPKGEGGWEEPPQDDPAFAAMLGLERRILHAALDTDDDAQTRRLAAAFVAVRHARRHRRSAGLLRYEAQHDYSEGTASYVPMRLMQILAKELALEPVGKDDPAYHAFADAAARYRRSLDEVLPGKGTMLTFQRSMYEAGKAQCLILDRVRPGWKEEMRETGIAQFALLEREFPLEAAKAAELLAEVREEFHYEALLAEQTRLVDERVALLRGYLEGPGRRYRLYHHGVTGGFNWRPRGPVYHVPPALLPGGATRPASLWVGGIEVLEKPGLVFRTKDVPVLFRTEYLEWIDRKPVADGSDLVVESQGEDGGILHGVRVRTDQFSLEAPRARIVRGQDLVEIHALGEAGK